MFVVFDTTSLFSQAFATSPLFRFILFASNHLGYTVCIPAIAFEENIAHYMRTVTGSLKKAEDGVRELNQRLVSEIPLRSPSVEITSAVENFRRDLTRTFDDFNVIILDYPSVSHESLVRKAVMRERPFDGKGSGYRDALIWESILELYAEKRGEIVFVTQDGDFQKDGKIHSELMGEFFRRGGRENDLVLVNTVSAFDETYVRNNMENVLVEDPIQSLQHIGVDYEDLVTEAVRRPYARRWSPEELGLSSDFELLSLESVDDVSDLSVDEIRKLDDTRLLITIDAILVCEFNAYVDKSSAYGLEDFVIYDHDWNDRYVWGAITLPVECILDLDIDTSDTKNRDVQVLSMEPIDFLTPSDDLLSDMHPDLLPDLLPGLLP